MVSKGEKTAVVIRQGIQTKKSNHKGLIYDLTTLLFLNIGITELFFISI